MQRERAVESIHAGPMAGRIFKNWQAGGVTACGQLTPRGQPGQHETYCGAGKRCDDSIALLAVSG